MSDAKAGAAVPVHKDGADGKMLSIDTIAVENEVAANMFEQSELDYLIYHDPVGYADLILNGDPGTYLRQVTDYHPLDI